MRVAFNLKSQAWGSQVRKPLLGKTASQLGAMRLRVKTQVRGVATGFSTAVSAAQLSLRPAHAERVFDDQRGIDSHAVQ